MSVLVPGQLLVSDYLTAVRLFLKLLGGVLGLPQYKYQPVEGNVALQTMCFAEALRDKEVAERSVC